MAAETNPYDELDEQPAPVNAAPAASSANPFDELDEPSPVQETAAKLQHTVSTADQSLPEVVVQARGGPESDWSKVANSIMPTIGAKIETKAAGAQEAFGNAREQSAKKKLWQSLILPDAVKDAKAKGIVLTEQPDVVDIAQHLGLRPDQFTRDWPTYVNMTPEELQAHQAEQREKLQAGQVSAQEGAKRRQTAAKVSAGVAPNIPAYGVKSLAFNTATMIPDLLAGTAATVATGGIGGAAVMAASIAPEEYADARNRGLNDRDASTYATLSTLASSVPEVPVLKVLADAPGAQRFIGSVVGQKLAGTTAGHVVGGAVAQGVTQSVVQALQVGIDEKMFNENTSLPEALKKIAFAGVTGAAVGGATAGAHGAVSGTVRAGAKLTGAAAALSGKAADRLRDEALKREAGAAPSVDEPSPSPQRPGREPGESQEDYIERVRQAHNALLPPLPPPPRIELANLPETFAAKPSQPEAVGEIQPLEGQDLHDALKAVQDKTVNPGQLERLEAMKLATRNDVGDARLLPSGRRQLAQSLRASSQPGKSGAGNLDGTAFVNEDGEEATVRHYTDKRSGREVVHVEAPGGILDLTGKLANPDPASVADALGKIDGGQWTAQPTVTHEPGSIEHRVATDADLRQGLDAMKGETGWAEEGGKLLRNASGEVSGRTAWIPNAEWWPQRPKGLTEPQIHEAVDKALGGEPLTTRQRAMVEFMADVHAERTTRQQIAGEFGEAVPDFKEQPKAAVDLSILSRRAHELDPEATGKVLDGWEDDRPATIARIQGEFEKIIGRHGEQSQEPSAAESGAAERAPQEESFGQALERARQETHVEPTDGQKEAGNYKKGRLEFAGMEVALENPKGSVRRGISDEGKPWQSTLQHDYGYVVGTEGRDGDAVDTFLTGKPDTGKVYVVNQVDPKTGQFDEHKAVLGAATEGEARATYEANYPRGWKGEESIAELPTGDFRAWVHSGGPARGPIRPPSKLERRTEAARRKKVAEMSAEEAKKELLTHELTGIPNRRAYIESDKLPAQVSIDVDSLKAVNDLGGHHAGDELLKAVAKVLHEETEHAYHLSGDEFAIQALHPREAQAIMERATERLKNAEVIVSMPDGRTLSLKGLGVSFGVGEDLAKADTALQAHKKQREAQGARAPRGEAPRGLTFRTGEAGREDRGGAGATEEEVGPKARRAETQTGLPRRDVERIVHQTVREANLVSGFPHVEVHEDVSTLPKPIQSLIAEQGAQRLTGAVYDPSTGRIHVIAGNNGSEREVRENLWHEAVGHHGLRMAMDAPQYAAVMDGINRDMPERVEAAARRNGLDYSDPIQRRAAAEEVVAYAAGQHLSGQPIDKPVIPWFKRVMRAVKGFFSRMAGKPFYDDAAIAGLIQQAHKALEAGAPGTVPGEPVRSTRAPTFYSPVERAVEGSKQGKASAEQWLATLKKTAGVKPEEMEFLGLEDWLRDAGRTEPTHSDRRHAGKPRMISKEEILDYIRANRLDLEETLHESGTQTADESMQIRLAEEIRAEGHEIGFGDDGALAQINVRDPSSPTGWSLHDPSDPEEFAALPDSIRDRVRLLDDISERVAAENHENTAFSDREGETRYGDYTLPGGQNYREMLLRLPEKQGLPEGYRVEPNNGRVSARYSHVVIEPKYNEVVGFGTSERDAVNYVQGKELTRIAQGTYRSSHWNEPNILAHVRFNERTDVDGKKLLFLEELQSDWHQTGRQRGYPQDAETVRAAEAKRDEAGGNLAAVQTQMEALKKDPRKGSYPWQQDVMAATLAHQEAREKFADAQNAFDRAKGAVPDAPFKTSWPMLIMKRMVRWAAENGFERIAWTTGDQQNERYSLEHHVQRMDVTRQVNPAGERVYSLNPRYDEGGSVPGFDRLIPESDLDDYVGRELAERLRNGPDRHTYSGIDLRTGGEGMRGFYDQILPRETDKLIKKYGGKVQDAHVLTDTPPFDRELNAEPPQRVTAVHGFDVTPEMRTAALSQGFPLFARRQQQLALQQPGPKGVYERIKKAVDWLMENPASRDIRKLVHPAGMSPEARRTAQIATEALGKLAHETFETQHALEQFSRQIDKMPVADQLAMMDDIEHGRPQAHPELQPMADQMRKLLDQWRDKVRGLGSGYLDKFIENYFPHYWDRGDEAQRLVASIQGRRTLRGPASFLKLRTIPTIKEGMEAGLRPLTVNPLVMTLLKTREMQRFVTGVTLLRRLKEDGLAEFIPSSKQVPDGWKEIDDPSARVSTWSEEEGGWVQRGRYAMPEDAARVINNHLSASWMKNFAPAEVFRVSANMLNALQLGFSAFHLGFTTLDAIISKTALGVERLAHGQVGKAAAAFGEAALGPVAAGMNVYRGHQLLKAYANPVGATPQMLKLVDALQKAGGRVQMDRYYLAAQGASPFHGVGVRSLANDVHQALTAPTDKLRNTARALGAFPQEYATALLHSLQQLVKTTHPLAVPFELAGRITRASTSWIMEHLVPLQKLGVFSDLAHDHIERNPNQDPNEQALALQKSWAAVDDRLGEMVYDNLFLNRTFKDVLHFGIRAVGWNWGTWRTIGGAPFDVMKMADKLISSGKVSADDLGHKIPYVMAMAMTTALYGAFYQYMATGEGPQELKDYFFPRTGGTTNYGTPQRVSLPSYAKDVYEYSQHPGTTILNKLNPIFNVIGEMWNNEDFFGNPITDPDATDWEATKQRAHFLGGEMQPFSLQGGKQPLGPPANQLAPGEKPTVFVRTMPMHPYFGVTPAPGYVTSPEQMERRERYEREQKYTRDMQYKMKKAYESGDKATGDEYRDRYTKALQHMKETEGEVKQDRGKAAVQRRKAATSMRQQGLPHTADLVASLPLEPDAQARRYFTELSASG